MSSLYVLLWTSLRLALRQLMRHKVRSFLTMLGIFIGVGAVVAIVSLGEGLRGMFNDMMSSTQADDLIYVMPDVPMNQRRMARAAKPLKNRDLAMVLTSEYIKSGVGMDVLDPVVAKHGWRSGDFMCCMVAHTYFAVENMQVEQGRLYTTSEERGRASVCIVGSDIPKDLYAPGEEVLGSPLMINGARFTIIGVLKSRSTMQGGQQHNRMICVPLETGQDRLTGRDDLYFIVAQVKDKKDLALAKEDVAARMRASRRIRSGSGDDFKIQTMEDWANFGNNFVDTLITVFGVVALIALLVGGIGVMNIMLVSVKERTREIGLRKALGATAVQVTWQFLVESITLTLFGGLIGLGVGYALGGGVSLILKATLDVFWLPQVPLNWIIIVMATSIGLGLVFGVYPAYRAGQLDPIVALRYE